ncbi:hypothetical protein GCM10008015_19740 [Flavobacterium palustre]|uniref:KAP NTPase domain-containing protein n=1 Tax=Flavobacterium palustre TaxID=1476463 RepID=A0ABQ1HIA1_9FLAO|nr:P-loop NTPase fold protein [Flavobacterium palustre]GGA79070.1 hypothetical protein GCM10008015_19740 [Flavobacterium palustre]
MTKPRLLSNLPIEDLTSETDYLGIIDKGDLIKAFLIGNKDQFNEIKMFSLYGEWGSGKSSLMKYLEKELKSDFNTFFFEAWEFEKDENLAMSLLEFITSKNIDITEELYSEILKYGGRILRGLGKSIKMNIPLYPNGPGIELDPSAFVQELSKNEELTFYNALEKFKTEFRRFEDKITNGENPKYNIVFIDDLDRCEPEQVLNLLSAIKLFFIYGQKTIFFCGIDKKAVGQAIKTKYGEIVKSNEYLEKIFDVSFSMPEHDDVLKLISVYFDNREIKLDKFEGKLNKKIGEFFIEMKFTNPRRLKKILNKYLILSNFKTVLKDNPKHENSIPNIFINGDNEGNFFETILTLYFLCLYEYERDSFELFNNMNLKKQALKLAVERFHSHSQKEISSTVTNIVDAVRFEAYTLSLSSLMGRYVKGEELRGGQDLTSYRRNIKFYFFIQFIDGNGAEIGSGRFIDGYSEFSSYYRVTTKKIDYFFSSYLVRNFDNLIQQDNFSNFSLSKYKDMIEKLL